MNRKQLEKGISINNKILTNNSILKTLKLMRDSNQKSLIVSVVEGLNVTRQVHTDRKTLGIDIIELMEKSTIKSNLDLEIELENL